jgi:hypothetical protein
VGLSGSSFQVFRLNSVWISHSCPTHFIVVCLITVITLGDEYKLWRKLSCDLLYPHLTHKYSPQDFVVNAFTLYSYVRGRILHFNKPEALYNPPNGHCTVK